MYIFRAINLKKKILFSEDPESKKCEISSFRFQRTNPQAIIDSYEIKICAKHKGFVIGQITPTA